LVDADDYLKYLSRYIHLNPKRAKVVTDAADYEWTSYRAFIGKISEPEWLCVGWLLEQFGNKRQIAHLRYRKFVEEANSKTLENPSNKIVSGMILGDDEFVQWVKKTFLVNRSDDPELPQLRELMPRCTLDHIIEVVADVFNVTKDQILEKGRKNNLARDISIYFSKVYCGKSGVEIAQFFGMRSGSAVTMRYNTAHKKIEKSKKLDVQVSLIKQRIMNN
jgi:hypothetical protein